MQISGKYSPLNDNIRLDNPSHLNSHIQILEKSKLQRKLKEIDKKKPIKSKLKKQKLNF